MTYGLNVCGDDGLCDLEADPREMRNVIRHPAYRQAAGEMRKRLADWMAGARDPGLWMYGFLITHSNTD